MRKSLLTLILIFVFCSNLCADLFERREFEKFASAFYADPQPARTVKFLDDFLVSGEFKNNLGSKSHVNELAMYFFARVANFFPGILRDYERIYSQQDTNGKIFLLYLFTYASDAANKEFLRNQLKNEKQAKLRRLIEKVIQVPPQGNRQVFKKSPDAIDIDFLWVEFFVTGEKKPIAKIIDCLNRKDILRQKIKNYIRTTHVAQESSQMQHVLNDVLGLGVNFQERQIDEKKDLDCIFVSYLQYAPGTKEKDRAVGSLIKILEITKEDIGYMANKGTALWSLEANASGHPLVLQYSQQEIESRNDKAKIELENIVNKIKKR